MRSNGQELLKIMGELDEALIAEAAEPMSPMAGVPTEQYLMRLTPQDKTYQDTRSHLRRILAVVAAVLLLCGLMVGMYAVLNRESGYLPPVDTKEHHSGILNPLESESETAETADTEVETIETEPEETVPPLPEHVQYPLEEELMFGDPELLEPKYTLYTSYTSQVLDYRPAITVRALDLLPDTYRFYSQEREYRLVRMQTLHVPDGSSVPDHFYYMLPVELTTDLTRFDCLLLTTLIYMGPGNQILCNVTDDMLECIPLTLLGNDEDGVACPTPVFAFTDGLCDEALWAEDAWDSLPESYIRGWSGRTLEEIRTEINSNKYLAHLKVTTMEELYEVPVFTEALDYIKPFDHGVFIGNKDRYYRRRINGYLTNEVVWLYHWVGEEETSNKVITSDVQFTAEDIAGLPDPAPAIQIVASWAENGELTPLHIIPEAVGALTDLHVRGWYAKGVDGKVYTVIRAFLLYENALYMTDTDIGWDENVGTKLGDDLYFLVDPATGEPSPIDEQVLLELISFNRETAEFVNTYPYSDNGSGIDGNFPYN